MQSFDWTVRFRALYDKAVAAYNAGQRNASAFFDPEETRFLESIGARPMELYDFAEDAPGLDRDTALLIASARRDYFMTVQHSKPSGKRLTMADFPAKDAELNGIPWLPRLILKAQCRLRGEMPEDMMYGCAGDRRFFKQHDLHPADFLRFMWAADGNEEKVLRFLRGLPVGANGPSTQGQRPDHTVA